MDFSFSSPRGLVVIHVIVPIFMGGMIYVAFRSSSLLMFQWFKISKLDFVISHIRWYVLPLKPLLPEFIVYSLPNALWVYSFTSLMVIVWFNIRSVSRLLWIFIGPLLGISWEIGQLIGFIPGKFDVYDCLWCAIAFIASLFFTKTMTNRRLAV